MSKKVTKIKIGDETYDILASSPMKVNIGTVPIKPQIGQVYYGEWGIYFRGTFDNSKITELKEIYFSPGINNNTVTYIGPSKTYTCRKLLKGGEDSEEIEVTIRPYNKNLLLIITEDILNEDGTINFEIIPDNIKIVKHLNCETSSPSYEIKNGKTICVAKEDIYTLKKNLFKCSKSPNTRGVSSYKTYIYYQIGKHYAIHRKISTKSNLRYIGVQRKIGSLLQLKHLDKYVRVRLFFTSKKYKKLHKSIYYIDCIMFNNKIVKLI